MLEKLLGTFFSARVQYSGGIAKGMNWNPAFNYGKNTAWKSNYIAPINVQSPPTVVIFANCKVQMAFYLTR
ncbi:MAG: hypothetical protein IPK31_03365 [Chitinophagaceae bacterium]|nr:hypothetical protein [Chitinophagaceae bacterium]